MLDHARTKRFYAELRQADIVADLAGAEQDWPLILAADVLCYFGALEELLALVHARLQPGGWFITPEKKHRVKKTGLGAEAFARLFRARQPLDAATATTIAANLDALDRAR